MSRGELDRLTLQRISSELPDLHELQSAIRQLSPDFISVKFAPSSRIPGATVCLNDVLSTLEEARHALHEALAHTIWYLEVSRPPNKDAAIFFSRFYLDDVALRLYSASEHLAAAIVDMLELTDEELRPYSGKRTSRQSIVGRLLFKERSGHPITLAVKSIIESSAWKQTMDYRNLWVHDQPPLVEGLGIVYERGPRWKRSADGSRYTLGLGGGDKPKYRVEQILGFVKPALSQFIEVVTRVVDYYLELLESRGIAQVEGEGLKIRLL